LYIIIYAVSSRSKEIYSIVNVAARRGGASANEDLSSRCLSLLDEVKDLIESHKSGENSASDREARPLSLPEASQGRSCL